MISPRSHERFPRDKRKDNQPGPGNYDHSQTTMSRTGEYFFSKCKNSGATKFFTSSRNRIVADSLRKSVPGPGAYQTSSEFGIYDSPVKSFRPKW